MIEDRSYGAVVVFGDKFLILKHKAGHWGFPKGHKEGDETTEETVIRELEEETGISGCKFLELPPISEEYNFTWSDGKEYHKIVQYIIGNTKEDKVILQEDEVVDYKWASYDEAFDTLTFDNNKEVLKKAKEYLGKYGKEE